jgi:hypothetical protein
VSECVCVREKSVRQIVRVFFGLIFGPDEKNIVYIIM